MREQKKEEASPLKVWNTPYNEREQFRSPTPEIDEHLGIDSVRVESVNKPVPCVQIHETSPSRNVETEPSGNVANDENS